MEELKILHDKELSPEASAIIFDFKSFENFAKNLFFTMKMSGGIGLAAPQVGNMIRIIVIDTTPVKGGTFKGIMLNPEALVSEGSCEYDEGCLSFPGKTVHTQRSAKVTVKYQDFNGNTKTREFTGIDAICAQHEIDHLNGITFLERVVK